MTDYASREPAAKLAAFIRGELQKAVIVLAVILDAIHKVTAAARKRFREIYTALIQTLKGRLQPAEDAQVDEELNK